jgi:hypothetical protein
MLDWIIATGAAAPTWVSAFGVFSLIVYFAFRSFRSSTNNKIRHATSDVISVDSRLSTERTKSEHREVQQVDKTLDAAAIKAPARAVAASHYRAYELSQTVEARASSLPLSDQEHLRLDFLKSISVNSSLARGGVRSIPPAEILATQRGQMVEKIPREMTVDVREPVEIRIAREEIELPEISLGLVGTAPNVTQHLIDVVETMTVELVAPSGAFTIETGSPSSQLVLRKSEALADDWGRWLWYVTPKESGTHTLTLRVSAGVLDSRGVPTNAALPDQNIDIVVSVNVGKASGRIVKAAGGAVATGLVAGATREYWFPWLAGVARVMGWLK